jgi:hypothetical protein
MRLTKPPVFTSDDHNKAMSSSSSSARPDNSPFMFILPATSFIAGSTLMGSIVLDLARAQDVGLTSVQVKLRGTTQTSVRVLCVRRERTLTL